MQDSRRYKYEQEDYMLWDDRWDTDTNLFREYIQSIMDKVADRSFSVRPGSNKDRSPADNLDIFDGNLTEDIRRKYFEKALYTYGAEGAGDLEDYGFFLSSFESLHGITLKMPTDIRVANVTPGVTEEKKKRNADFAAAMQRNQIVMQLGEDTGQDVSDFLRDNMPTDLDQLLVKLNSPEEHTYIIMRLLTNLRKKTNVENELQKSDRYMYCQNRVAARILINKNNEPSVQVIDPATVAYIGNADIESLEDPSVSMVSHHEYLTLPEATAMFGHGISKKSGWKEMKKALDDMASGRPFDYNPNSWRYGWFEENPSEETKAEAGWWSYNGFYVGDSKGIKILCQTVYARMITEQKAILKYKGKDPEQDKINDYHNGLIFDQDDWTTENVEKDCRHKKSEHIVSLPKEEMWEFVRLGHSMLVRARKYPYDTPGHSGDRKTEFPIIMMQWSDPSMVERGKSAWRQHAVMMERASEAVNMSGISDVMLVDKNQKTTSLKHMLHSARKGGVIEFDSTQVQGVMNRDEKGKHLSTIKLGSQVQDVLTFLQAADLIKSSFEKTIGLNDQQRGQAGAYQGISTINRLIEQSSKLTQFFFFRSHLFRDMVFRRYIDIIKHHYARDQKFSLFFGKGEVELVKSTKKLAFTDFESHVESGISLFEEKQFIMSTMEKGISSGAATTQDYIKLYRAENSSELLEVLKVAEEKADQMQQSSEQSRSQQMQQQAQIEGQRMQVPLEREKMITEREMQLQDREMQHDEGKWNHEKDLEDLDSQGKLDKEEAQQAGDAEKMMMFPSEQPAPMG